MNTASWPIGVSRAADKAESTHLAAPEGPGAPAACSRACVSPRGALPIHAARERCAAAWLRTGAAAAAR